MGLTGTIYLPKEHDGLMADVSSLITGTRSIDEIGWTAYSFEEIGGPLPSHTLPKVVCQQLKEQAVPVTVITKGANGEASEQVHIRYNQAGERMCYHWIEGDEAAICTYKSEGVTKTARLTELPYTVLAPYIH